MFKRKSKTSDEFLHIVKEHIPSGYMLIERPMTGSLAGYALFIREINCEPITDRERLFVFLHECGHVHYGHLRKGANAPRWLEEFEADQYAISAMKTHGISIPKHISTHHKSEVRRLIEEDGETVDDIRVLKYAYGKNWRKHQ